MYNSNVLQYETFNEVYLLAFITIYDLFITVYNGKRVVTEALYFTF